jgi:hypothetical protein
MRLINRTAVSVVGAGPYLEWTRARDAAFAPAKELSVAVPRAKPFGSVYLLPEGIEEEDLLEWVEDNFAAIFESQLAAWTEDESAWPGARDLRTFRQWFRVDLHGTVVDIGEEEIEGEEL